MSDWTQNDELWETARRSMFPESSFAAAPGEVAAVLRLIGASDALDVLDLPCGPGRHAIAFAATGHRVTGVDRTRSYLDEASRRRDDRARRMGRPLALELVEADMREFLRPASYDLAVNLFTSIGYFRDPEEDRRVLRNFRTNLRDGGTLVIDTLGREVLAAKFEPRVWSRLDDGTLLLQERAIRDDWTWIEVMWKFVRDGEERTFDFSHRIHGVVDLRRELLDAGFSRVDAFGGFDGRPYDNHAHRLVLTAHA